MDKAHIQSIDDIFTIEKKATWSDAQFWRGMCNKWTITGIEMNSDINADSLDRRAPIPISNGKDSLLRTRLLEDGYALLDRVDDNARFDELSRTLQECITMLHLRRIPATFVLLCDETWEFAHWAKNVLKESTHPSNCFNFDVLAWYIDPKENAAGFSPHRDRQPEDTSSGFHGDHQAKYVTLWTALSDATPENSCLYVIPKQYDPGYLTGDGDDDPLQRALATKESFQCIRALPRRSGESVIFSHRILHWGSRGNQQTSPGPRIAISFVCSDPTFEHPYVNPKYFEASRTPPFRIRLLLLCAQLLIYYQRFGLSKNCVRSCYEFCKENEADLDPVYRGKIGVEFVKAMKEFADASHTRTSDHFHCVISDEAGDDAVLEEMLEAEQQGYGEFEDDYDETNNHHEDGDGDEISDTEDEEEAEEGALFGKRQLGVGDNEVLEKKAKNN